MMPENRKILKRYTEEFTFLKYIAEDFQYQKSIEKWKRTNVDIWNMITDDFDPEFMRISFLKYFDEENF